MDRRRFLQRLAATTAGAELIARAGEAAEEAAPDAAPQSTVPDTGGHTQLCEFSYGGTTLKVYEDLSKRDGSLTFVPARGTARILTKRPEACFTQAAKPYLGFTMPEIGSSLPDILADKLLSHGDPDEIEVRDAAPVIGSPMERPANAPGGGNAAGGGGTNSWNTFVGTKECFDTAPVYAG